MQVLHAHSHTEMIERTKIFDEHMEPMLGRLEAAYRAGHLPVDLPEFCEYLQVCRWPFRRLEYSFALEALIDHLRPGDRYLDAGCGVTPLAQVLADRGVRVDACDGDQRVVTALRNLRPETIYGVEVEYAAQDLTSLAYPDAVFDAVSCISVLEHIAAPFDQEATRELLRVLKPGGLLVLTVDFAPSAQGPAPLQRAGYLISRTAKLVRRGDLSSIARGLASRLRARQTVRGGLARRPRSPNQSFEIEHLEQDLLPLLAGEERCQGLPSREGLQVATRSDARRFWKLQPELYRHREVRDVLPAAAALKKPTSARSLPAGSQ